MKICKLLLTCLVALLFAGCKDDPEPAKNGLPGTWMLTSLTYDGTSTTNVQGVEIEEDFTGKGKEMNLTVTFKENPATFTSEGNYTIELTTSLQGQTLTQDLYFEGFLLDGSWSRDGDKLTITSTGGNEEATIVELTPTTFTLTYDLIQTWTEQDGSATIMDIHSSYTFERK